MSGDLHASLLPWLLLGLGFPLASCLVCYVIRPQISWLAPIVASLLMVAAMIFCLILFITRQAAVNQFLIYQWEWFDIGTSTIYFTLLLDNHSLVMLLMVVSISTLVHIYSAGYMVHDESQSRFFSLLGLFTFAMMGLVVSGNLIVLFCFWEMVGVTSYLLIGHWRSRPAAASAATKAFLFNRIGDLGFIAGLMIIWQNTGTFDLIALSDNRIAWSSAAGICIFFGAVGKSAQLPLMTWLPDAMEGPTPVSALIHAATMVAAGVFVLLRLQFLFLPDTLPIVAATGSITALYSGWLALKQTDLKKILAYSTISQLGIMMIAIGMQAFNGAFLHLITHGFFKACLFLSAGALIYAVENSRRLVDFDAHDIRSMGGFRHSFPMLFLCFCIAGASLAGLPLLSGFVSKEAMLVGMLANVSHWTAWIFIAVFMIASLLTVLYTFRMIKVVFFGPHPKSAFQPVAAVLLVPALICAGLSLWFFYSPNPLAYTAWFQYLPQLLATQKSMVTIMSIVWVSLSVAAAYLVYRGTTQIQDVDSSPIDRLYQYAIITPVIKISAATTFADDRFIDRLIHRIVYAQVAIAKIGGAFDRYIIDGLVSSVSWVVNAIGNVTRSLVRGKVQSYLLWAIAGFVALLYWFLR